jgi:chromosome segregation ATPase
MTDII